MTDISPWLPRLHQGLLRMRAHADPRLREIAGRWLGALGALVVSLEAADSRAERLRARAQHDFTLGLQGWMLAADAGAADEEMAWVAQEAIDQLLARAVA